MMEIIDRLNEKSVMITETGCQVWEGYTIKAGYGVLTVKKNDKKEKLLAHRLMWEHHNGEIPEKMVICHKCDNPSCINIDHLFIGTYSDNMQDMVRKGRAYYHEGTRIGADNPNSKLTNEQVLYIFSSDKKPSELANQFNVAQSTISGIKSGARWSSVTGGGKDE